MSATRFAALVLFVGCAIVPAQKTGPPVAFPSPPASASPASPPATSSTAPSVNPTNSAEPTPLERPTPEPTPEPTARESPWVVPEAFSIVWRDEPGCGMHDVTMVIEITGPVLTSAGHCDTEDGLTTAMAWESADGFTWRRILSPEPATYASGVATDGLGSVVVVGTKDDGLTPLFWESVSRRGSLTPGELPTDSVGASAQRVAHAFNSYLVIGTVPAGIVGEPRPVAWLKVVDGADWTLVEPPVDASSFVDVIDSSVFREGVVRLSRTDARREFNGDRFTIAGTTTDGESALWIFTVDGTWDRIDLPRAEDPIQEVLDPFTALGTQSLWTRNGENWIATPLGHHFEARTLVRGRGRFGNLLFIAGVRTETGTMVAIHSSDGVHWTAIPEQPDYLTTSVESLASLEDRVVGVGDAVYMGAPPAN